MKDGIFVQQNVIIPFHEIDITTSRSGGAGGQHVNKTDTRVTVRWNVHHTQALTDEQKTRVLEKLHNRLTAEGDLIIHNSASRSQQHNKKEALANLAKTIKEALYIPKKRIATQVSKALKEARLKSKARRSSVKKMRTTFTIDE